MEPAKQFKLEPDKQSALDHFGRVDPKLEVLAKRHLTEIGLPTPLAAEKRTAVLMKSIVGRQI